MSVEHSIGIFLNLCALAFLALAVSLLRSALVRRRRDRLFFLRYRLFDGACRMGLLRNDAYRRTERDINLSIRCAHFSAWKVIVRWLVTRRDLVGPSVARLMEAEARRDERAMQGLSEEQREFWKKIREERFRMLPVMRYRLIAKLDQATDGFAGCASAFLATEDDAARVAAALKASNA